MTTVYSPQYRTIFYQEVESNLFLSSWSLQYFVMETSASVIFKVGFIQISVFMNDVAIT